MKYPEFMDRLDLLARGLVLFAAVVSALLLFAVALLGVVEALRW